MTRPFAWIALAIAIALTALATGCGSSSVSQSMSTALPSIGPGTVSTTTNPLVASYSVAVPAGSSTSVEFGTSTTYGKQTWALPSPSGGGPLTILVAGMLPSTTYHMRATSQLSGGLMINDSDHTFTTGALPADVQVSLTATTTPGMTPQSGVELIEISPLVVTDLNGNVIWYHKSPNGNLTNPAKMLPDGNFLINYSGVLFDGSYSLLQEVDLAGNVVWQLSGADLNQALATAGFNMTVVGTHHDAVLLPNGHLIVLANEQKSFTDLPGYPGTTMVSGDVVIDLDQNRIPVWTWSEFDHLDINRHPMSFPDWTHTNAVLYSPDDGDLSISIRHQHWLVKIDYQDGKGSGDIVWKLGWQGDFTLQGGTDPQDWFYAQHGPEITTSNSSGLFDMLLFDNGDNRQLDPKGDVCGGYVPCYSTVAQLQIDETAKTATIMGRDNLSPVFSFFGGNAELLGNGDWEFDEASPTGLAVPGAAIYEVTPDAAHQTVWNMQIKGQSAYRAFRMPSLYPGVQW